MAGARRDAPTEAETTDPEEMEAPTTPPLPVDAQTTTTDETTTTDADRADRTEAVAMATAATEVETTTTTTTTITIDAADAGTLTSRTAVRRKNEKVEIAGLCKSSADLKVWSSAVYDDVMACSSHGDAAYFWILSIEDEDATFDSLSHCEERFVGLDSKLRTALTRYTVGDHANK